MRSTEAPPSLLQRAESSAAPAARKKVVWLGRLQRRDFIKIIIFVGGLLAIIVAVGTWYWAFHVPNQRDRNAKRRSFTEHAMNLREQALKEVEPQVFVPAVRAPSQSPMTGQQPTSSPPGQNYVWTLSEGWKLKGLADVQSTKESSVTSAPTNQPLTRNDRTWQAWIGKFVRQFVTTNQLQDVNANLALYASNVDYFDDHQKDQAYIRNDVEKYNERWPVRRDSIEGDIKLQEKKPDKEYTASFKLNFYAESIPRDEWSEGQFAIDLDISIIDEVPKISGIKEKVLRQQKGTTQGNASNNTVASPSPAAEAQRNSFGIIEGDYNCQFRIHPKTKHVGDKFGGSKRWRRNHIWQ